jgi:KDO2-lipid IV(A) lauroyltransferase
MFWVVSRLDFYLLFKLSDFLFYIFYYIIRYRRQTVRHNLTLVFPEKSKKEIKNLELKTYRNLTDVILESIKFINMTENEVKERFQFKNIEVLKELEPLYIGMDFNIGNMSAVTHVKRNVPIRNPLIWIE